MTINILFLTPTLRRGGAETQLITLINAINPEKFESHLLCFDQDIHQIDKLSPNVKFHHHPRKSKYDFDVIRTMAKIIDDNEIHVVHCTLQIALFFGWAAKHISKTKPKLATTIHTTAQRDFRSELFSVLIYQWIMRSCDALIFVCDEQRKYWKNKWGFIKKKSLVVHNGIDTEFFQCLHVQQATKEFRVKHTISDDTKIIAHIAGFRPEKGHKLLIAAFKKVLTTERDALLIFAGDGVLRKECETLIQKENISSYVRFIGNISDVRPLLANADIAVIASTAVETFSIAMLEAMSMEVPLVATDIGGTREAVIPTRTGWLVPAGDSPALAAALCTALTNDKTRKEMSVAARQYVVENFTVETMTARMEELFVTLHHENKQGETATL